MSLTISGGGSGGGITIETDPTALKKASNLADLQNVQDAMTSLGLGIYGGSLTFVDGNTSNSVQVGSYVGGSGTAGVLTSWEGTAGTGLYYDGIHFADGTVLSSAAAAGGIALNSTNEGYLQLNGNGGNLVIGYDPLNNASGFSEILVNFEGLGTRVTYTGITFPDGTSQTTAYTGGGGGSVPELQRSLDIICALVGGFNYNFAGAGDYNISAGWAASYGMGWPPIISSIGNAFGMLSDSGQFLQAVYVDDIGFQTLNGSYDSNNWRLAVPEPTGLGYYTSPYIYFNV